MSKQTWGTYESNASAVLTLRNMYADEAPMLTVCMERALHAGRVYTGLCTQAQVHAQSHMAAGCDMCNI